MIQEGVLSRLPIPEEFAWPMLNVKEQHRSSDTVSQPSRKLATWQSNLMMMADWSTRDPLAVIPQIREASEFIHQLRLSFLHPTSIIGNHQFIYLIHPSIHPLSYPSIHLAPGSLSVILPFIHPLGSNPSIFSVIHPSITGTQFYNGI